MKPLKRQVRWRVQERVRCQVRMLDLGERVRLTSSWDVGWPGVWVPICRKLERP